jgi:N-acetyl-alpha-D-muramate 1-phosphate uridylyltransferase
MTQQQLFPMPHAAMVLAAGLGERMRPLTNGVPKPLVKVAGKALIDYVLDRLAEAGVDVAIVNVHYLADAVERHVRGRRSPHITISDERSLLLGTGGGVVKALPELGAAPFYHVNSDSIWLDGAESNLRRLAAAFDPARMDALLMLAPSTGSIGYAGRGDFAIESDARLRRRGDSEIVACVYAGAAILSPTLFSSPPQGAFSLNLMFDRAENAKRLYGLRLQGAWMHVGTPEAIAMAEAAILESAA